MLCGTTAGHVYSGAYLVSQGLREISWIEDYTICFRSFYKWATDLFLPTAKGMDPGPWNFPRWTFLVSEAVLPVSLGEDAVASWKRKSISHFSCSHQNSHSPAHPNFNCIKRAHWFCKHNFKPSPFSTNSQISAASVQKICRNSIPLSSPTPVGAKSGGIMKKSPGMD